MPATKTTKLSDTAIVVLARACRSILAGVPVDERPALRFAGEFKAAEMLGRADLGKVVDSDGCKCFEPSEAGFALFPSIDNHASVIEEERAGH